MRVTSFFQKSLNILQMLSEIIIKSSCFTGEGKRICQSKVQGGMAMSLDTLTAVVNHYSTYTPASEKAKEKKGAAELLAAVQSEKKSDGKASDTKKTDGKTADTKKTDGKTTDAKKTDKTITDTKKTGTAEDGVVYEKSQGQKKATYSINKMSESDRAALVEKLKAEQESRKQDLVNLVQKMMGQQAKTYADATDMWKFLASGEYTVDADTKAKAQQDISEDGYYGVKQTSQRLFDFASALSGGDVDKMKEMQKAMEKGYKLATGDWGRELPGICKDTIDAANKLFEDYYKSAEAVEAED